MVTQKNLHFHSINPHYQRTILFFLLIIIIIITWLAIAEGHSPTESHRHLFVYAGCSQEKYQPDTAFEANLKTFLTAAATSSQQSLYAAFAADNNTADSSLFGLHQCRGDLRPEDCGRCVGSAAAQVGLVCPYSLGASLQLEACLVRYEHFDFLGKPDNGVRFKKCSRRSASGDDPEFFRRRDDVLADLDTASGFRVSASGLVQGFAQCSGDLGEADCSACLVDCVGKLKSLCGSAAAADVFLGQCYARYWASGYYDPSSDSTNDDDVGKTVAIIVGVVAGIAILIVLLSICRKTMS